MERRAAIPFDAREVEEATRRGDGAAAVRLGSALMDALGGDEHSEEEWARALADGGVPALLASLYASDGIGDEGRDALVPPLYLCCVLLGGAGDLPSEAVAPLLAPLCANLLSGAAGAAEDDEGAVAVLGARLALLNLVLRRAERVEAAARLPAGVVADALAALMPVFGARTLALLHAATTAAVLLNAVRPDERVLEAAALGHAQHHRLSEQVVLLLNKPQGGEMAEAEADPAETLGTVRACCTLVRRVFAGAAAEATLFFYSSDVVVLVEVLLRRVENGEAGSAALVPLLQSLNAVVRWPGYAEERHRAAEIAETLEALRAGFPAHSPSASDLNAMLQREELTAPQFQTLLIIVSTHRAVGQVAPEAAPAQAQPAPAAVSRRSSAPPLPPRTYEKAAAGGAAAGVAQDGPLVLVALYDYAGGHLQGATEELVLRAGDRVEVVRQPDDGEWWCGFVIDDDAAPDAAPRVGWFPKSYVA